MHAPAAPPGRRFRGEKRAGVGEKPYFCPRPGKGAARPGPYVKPLTILRIMFSGIVEECATLVAMEKERENVHFTFRCSFAGELGIDQSVSHNGVCLTVVGKSAGTYTVTAMRETLLRSNLGLLEAGDEVNVERSMRMGGRLDGHIVQGHVDCTATCAGVEDAGGSYYFAFRYPFDREMAGRGYLAVDKGSIAVNGVSLTVCDPADGAFRVAVIPYTYERTNFHSVREGSVVNIEFDIIGKYVSRLALYRQGGPRGLARKGKAAGL